MFWRLLPYATAGIAADRIVVLDIRQDRYFIVPPAISPTMIDWLHASVPAAPPQAVVQLLQRSGVIRAQDAEPGPPTRFEIRIPTTLESDQPAPELGHLDALRVAGIVLFTWCGLRFTPLQTLLQRQQSRNQIRPATQIDPITLSRSFLRARHVIALERHCLLDSLALMHWLTSRGASAQLIFGVSTTPFAAHCWVQTDTEILNDSFDRVSRYTPILAQ